MKKERKCSKKKKIILGGILGVILTVVLVMVIAVAVIANQNVKAMNHCVSAVLEELEKDHTVTQLDPGAYEELTMYGLMKFRVEQYRVEGLGNLSIMRVNMGIMQMATVVITPTDKNLPLLSADYMYILTNRKDYLEFYDVVAEKDDAYMALLADLEEVQSHYDYLEDIQTAEAWYAPLLTVTTYKGGETAEDPELEHILLDSLHVYLEHADNFRLLTEEEKAEKLAITQAYTDGLIEKGGISTDVFKQELGDEETKKFFDLVFFGTKAGF